MCLPPPPHTSNEVDQRGGLTGAFVPTNVYSIDLGTNSLDAEAGGRHSPTLVARLMGTLVQFLLSYVPELTLDRPPSAQRAGGGVQSLVASEMTWSYTVICTIVFSGECILVQRLT